MKHFIITENTDGLLLILLIMLQTSAAKRGKFPTMSLDEIQIKLLVLTAAGKEKLGIMNVFKARNILFYIVAKDTWQAN